MKKAFALLLTAALILALLPAALADNTVTVSTVDEFLAAIAPDTKVELAPGIYDLSLASDYGKDTGSGCYYWDEVYDGYALIIQRADGMTLVGDPDGTEIVTPITYADVLCFEYCSNITVSGITAGHIAEPGSCSGDVLEFRDCRDTTVLASSLYGCGEIGVNAMRCTRLFLENVDIYSCSYEGVSAESCYDVRINNSRIRDCSAYCAFSVYSSYGFSVTNSYITSNNAFVMLSANYASQTYFGGCQFEGNRFEQGFFYVKGDSPTVESCSFSSTDLQSASYEFGKNDSAVTPEGTVLTEKQLASMTYAPVDYQGPTEASLPDIGATEPFNGETEEYRVSTVDEFLAALGSNRVIVLESSLYDLSTATGYGSLSGENWYWEDCYDGPGLVICNVNNLSIEGENATISAIPRYADVIRFDGCMNLCINGLTLGHTEAPGSCSGGVLYLDNCYETTVINCSLYGCGIMGIDAVNCGDIYIIDTEIYDCSEGAVSIFNTGSFRLLGCNIHGCGSPNLYVDGTCYFVYYENIELNPGSYDFAA